MMEEGHYPLPHLPITLGDDEYVDCTKADGQAKTVIHTETADGASVPKPFPASSIRRITLRLPDRQSQGETTLPCCLCPSVKDAPENPLLRVVEPPRGKSGLEGTERNLCVYEQEGEWQGITCWRAHELCARVVPDTWVDEVPSEIPGEMEKVVFGVENIELDRWNLKCSLCTVPRLRMHGAPVQCVKGRCSKAFHVSCANESMEAKDGKEIVFEIEGQVEKEIELLWDGFGAPPESPIMDQEDDSRMDVDVSSSAPRGWPSHSDHDIVGTSKGRDAASKKGRKEDGDKVLKTIWKDEVKVLCLTHNPVRCDVKDSHGRRNAKKAKTASAPSNKKATPPAASPNDNRFTTPSIGLDIDRCSAMSCQRNLCTAFGSYARERTNTADGSDLGALSVLISKVQEGDDLTILSNYRTVYEQAWDCLKVSIQKTPGSISKEEVFQCIQQDVMSLTTVITSTLKKKENINGLLACGEAQTVLDLIQDVLDSPYEANFSPSAVKRALVRLSSHSGLHPKRLGVTDLKFTGDHAIAGGAYADVWIGSLRGIEVATKVFRVFGKSDQKVILQSFLREALLWGQLRHQNLLPFYGLYKKNDQLCLLSPWMANGNMTEFLIRNPSADTLLLAHDIAHGVDYLHCKRFVHGDLKGLNVLITPNQRACIADFGLANLVESQSRAFSDFSSRPVVGVTARWQAPEILNGQDNSFSSDVYALGIVLYELFSGEIPFSHLRKNNAVIAHVMSGGVPERPQDFLVMSEEPFAQSEDLTNKLWSLMLGCWSRDPGDRPTAADVVKFIHDCGELRCPAPQWDNSDFIGVRQSLDEYPLFPSLEHVERMLQSPTQQVRSE